MIVGIEIKPSFLVRGTKGQDENAFNSGGQGPQVGKTHTQRLEIDNHEVFAVYSLIRPI